MTNSPIQIGPINLQDFEVPTSVRFGGRQRLAVHRLAGGHRIVERLGPDDDEITFKGTFSGPNAESRVRTFDDLRLSGAIVWLTWESFKRRVVVRRFVADYHSSWWIPYQVSCVVVHQAGAGTSQASDMAVNIEADLNSALSIISGSPIQLSTLQSALSQENVLVNGTSNHSHAVAAAAESLAVIEAQIAQKTALLTVGPRQNASPGRAGDMFNLIVNSAGSLASAVAAKAYVGRIGVNLNGSFI